MCGMWSKHIKTELSEKDLPKPTTIIYLECN